MTRRTLATNVAGRNHRASPFISFPSDRPAPAPRRSSSPSRLQPDRILGGAEKDPSCASRRGSRRGLVCWEGLEHLTRFVQTFERLNAAIGEHDLRTGHELADGRRDEHLVRVAKRGYARRDDDRDPADRAAVQFHFARVDPDARSESNLSIDCRDLMREPDRLRGRAECRQQAIAGSVDFCSTTHEQQLSNLFVVAREQIAPSRIADARRYLRRANEIEEKDRSELTPACRRRAPSTFWSARAQDSRTHCLGSSVQRDRAGTRLDLPRAEP